MTKQEHKISIADAAKLTLNWRHNMPAGGFKAGMFDKVAFDRLFAQQGCVGIRIYMGLHDKSDPVHGDDPSLWTFVMVGTDAEGNDITSTTSMKTGATTNADADDGDAEQNPLRCPLFCPKDSPLNTPP